jgi:hypothetical protein
MTAKSLIAILVATLVVASGTSPFYLAGAQEQATEQAEITLSSTEAQPGSEIQVNGSGFGSDAEVSIYIMSAAQANLTNGSAFILQEISNQSATSAEPESGNFLDDALDALEDLLGLSGDQDAAQGNLLVVLEEALENGTLGIECDEQELAEGDVVNGLVSLEAPPGSYDECVVSISDGDTTDIGEVGSLTIASDPDEGYEGSLAGSVTSDGQGLFAAPVAAPQAEGEYAILAVEDDGAAAVSELSVIVQPTAGEEALADNATGEQNVTDGAVNGTGVPLIMPAPEDNATAQNQTEGNQTATSGEASVQVDESDAEPGSPLAISGDSFQPNTPVQIFINNVQITNVITNIEGSFNTVIIVPTTVNAGSAEVVVRTEQTNIVENVNIVEPDGQSEGPATLRFTAVSATDNAQALSDAPVAIFDASSGQVAESGETPLEVELEEGTYSVFYSDFGDFDFESAEPGRWTDTPDGGSGLITVREGRNATVTAMYSESPPPPAPPTESENTLTLRAEDTDGNPVQGMFVTVYDGTGVKVEQGFTELRVEDLPPGTYPIFFANFGELAFVSASPGSWVQTPFGGAGLVSIPDDGEDRNIVVTAVYDRVTETAQEQFNVQAPLNIRGDIFTITSNETRPEGPFVMSGSFALRVDDEDPVRASLSAYFVSAREDSNENVELDSQRSRDHDTFQIVDLNPQVARPAGLDSYVVSGTADLLLNGDMYSNDERVVVMVRGGEELAPTNVEIEFQGEHRYSAANRLDTLYGAVTSGFQ